MNLNSSRVESRESNAAGLRRSTFDLRPAAAFTMIEIAISLAVVGIALVTILGFLPLGMRVQRDNREQTVINQDVTVLVEAIRNGGRGNDDLTNYVYAITNYWTKYTGNSPGTTQVNGYDYADPPQVSGGYFTTAGSNLINGSAIVGLLTTPEFLDENGVPIYFPTQTNGVPYYPSNSFVYYSNHIVAYVHSISGPAIEKPPQNNTLLRDSSFSYKVLCVNAPLALDVNTFCTAYGTNLMGNLHELRLTFQWPILPNGTLGHGQWTYRVSVPGKLLQQANLYFYQSQFFGTNNINTNNIVGL